MYIIRILCFAGLLITCTDLCGQSSYKIGLLPSINTSIPIVAGWKVNTKIELREVFIRGNPHGSETQFDFELLDIGAIVNKKFGRNTLGFGYLVRLEDHEAGHRFIQQYTLGRGAGSVTLAHRLSTDQTFRPSEPPEFRLRYRIGADIPLNGESVDPGEFYVKCSNEYLGIRQSSDTDLEIRVLSVLGRSLTQSNKIEFGPEYRVNGLLNNKTRHTIWIVLAGFLSF